MVVCAMQYAGRKRISDSAMKMILLSSKAAVRFYQNIRSVLKKFHKPALPSGAPHCAGSKENIFRIYSDN